MTDIVQVKRLRTIADLRARLDVLGISDALGIDDEVDASGALAAPFTFTDGAPGRMSRTEMLMHVITHGIGHRGQISAVMLLNSVPAAKDGFTTYLHEAEASTRRRIAA